MSSYLTDQEVEQLQTTKLSREMPFLMQGVSRGHFSIARYYGSIEFNGVRYTYLCDTDELIRDDVLAHITRQRKAQTKSRKKNAIQQTPELFSDAAPQIVLRPWVRGDDVSRGVAGWYMFRHINDLVRGHWVLMWKDGDEKFSSGCEYSGPLNIEIVEAR